MARMVLRLAIGGALLALGSCSHPAPPARTAKFHVGDPFLSAGKWEYPQDFTRYDTTGLAVVLNHPAGAVTADNEAYDPDALQAASAVLQLPAIVTVTDLSTGRSVDVRVNDRLVNDPGRVIGVTPKVAELLGFPQGAPAEVQVTLNTQRTAELDAALGDAPKLTAAPEAAIEAQNLAPPGQDNAVGPVRQLTPEASTPAGPDPGALSGVVHVTAPAPGPLWVQIPGFGRRTDADRTLEKLYGLSPEVVPVFGGSRTLWAVRLGPYRTVADADAAFKAALARGVADPEIIVR